MAGFLHLVKGDSAALAASVIDANRREPDARVTVVLLDGAAAPALPSDVTVRRLAEGDLDYAGLLPRMREAGYAGAFGCEYRPLAAPEATLALLRGRLA